MSKPDLSHWDEDVKKFQTEIARMEPHVEFMRALWEELTEKYCPMTLIFYRRNKPKTRNVRKAKTRMQNVNSYISVCMRDFNELGQIKRILKHKGFPDLIAMIDPTPYELENLGYSWRCTIRKWRNAHELSLALDITPEEAVLISTQYPTRAWGQLKFA